MYKHIGRKVRGLAVAIFVIGLLGAAGAGVYLGVQKILDLPVCIAIGAGGVILSWLVSWVLYCIGDTHARIERLEEKLIPKPNYMEYLSTNTAQRGRCEICGKVTDLVNAKIEDNLGVRYRKVCRECFAANQCSEAD